MGEVVVIMAVSSVWRAVVTAGAADAIRCRSNRGARNARIRASRWGLVLFARASVTVVTGASHGSPAGRGTDVVGIYL
jgi:hypothetical protein